MTAIIAAVVFETGAGIIKVKDGGHVSPKDARFGFKLGQIGPKWDKPCDLNQSQYILTDLESPRFVLFGDNFEAKPDIPGRRHQSGTFELPQRSLCIKPTPLPP